MMGQPENLLLEDVRAVRGDIARIANRMRIMSSEITIIRQHLSSVVIRQEQNHSQITAIKIRLDRIEEQLDAVG